MKKIVLGIIVLLLLALAGAAFYVTNIDWNQHKDKIAEQFYNSTGKTISFDGRVSFKIFPSPYLNAVDAKIYNDDNKNGKPLLEIKNVVAELALMPLLKGEFDVKKMVLDGAVINIDWDSGGLNWQGDLSPDQRQMMEDTKMVLNSVSLKNAVVNFEAADSGINLQLTNLNGEVSAQSVFGPFRIEGNYLKGTSPEGFALSIGKLSESFATTLNMVVTHPQSNSYVRFDGSFHLINKVLNGNVIVESQKLSDFVNATFTSIALPADYNQQAAIGFDIALNPQNLNLSNIVVKYGNTQGAGNLQMPLEDLEVLEITTSFNFADLDIDPLVKMITSFAEKYKEAPYTPDYKVDLTAEIKAVRASYEGQGLKNLAAEFSLDSDTLTIDDLSVVLPGDTSLKLKGSVYPYDDEVYYQAEASVSANDLMRTLRWLNMEPKANAASVYKKMLATAKIAGNFDKLQISPYKITLDKSTLSGEAGVVLGARKDIMLVVSADTINFDNYISSLPEEEKSKSWAERMAYRFSKLSVLNDFDMVLNAKADLVIYESMPFEKVDFKGNILNGTMDVEYCKIEQVANTAVGLKGKVSGFGSVPLLDNLQYEIKSNDVASLINKLELRVPNLDYKKFSNLNMSGIINGSSESFGINTLVTLGSLNAAYQGRIAKESGLLNYDGELEVKHPDFVKLLDNLKVKYEPEAKNLGLLKAKAYIQGNEQELLLKDLDANIGYTNLTGELSYDHHGERPSIIGDIKINKLEIDRFLQKSKNTVLIGVQPQDEAAAFLAKPFWNREKIDYSPYIYADVKGSFDIAEFSYKNYLFKDSKFKLELVSGTANISEFNAIYNNTPLVAAAALYMRETPTLTVSAKIDDANVNDFVFGGKEYYLKGGKFSTRFDFSSKADSQSSFAENLKGKAEFKATATEAGGINLKGIYDGLIKRENTSGLAESIKSEIGSGKTLFDKVAGRLIVDNGKFSLADASMLTHNAEIKLYGEGDIDDWNMNVIFNVKYNEPKYLPEFSFSLKNSMDNPLVDVNVSSLFKLYKAREDQKEAAKAAEVEAEKSYWADLVQEQKKIADDLVLSTRNKLEKDVEAKMMSAANPESVNKYNLLKQEIGRTLAQLIETMDAFDLESADDEKLKQLSGANKKAMQDVERFGIKRDEIYLADLKKQNEASYNKIVEMHNLLKQNIFNYSAQLDKYNERMSRIVSDYNLDEDENFKALKEEIDGKVAELEKLNDETVAAQKLKKDDATIAEYEKYNQDLAQVYAAIKDGRQVLTDKTAALDKYAQPKVAAAEKAYYDKVEQEENRRRLEENTGSISIKKTGRTLKVIRDIEEIKNAEEEVTKEGVKVLDFSKEKISLDKPEETDNQNVIKKGRNIRVN